MSNSSTMEDSRTRNRDSAAAKWLQAALWAWLIFAVALCVKVLVQGEHHSVYPAFSGGSQDWWDGEVMYDHQGYYYSPTFSVLFTPFALLPERLGQMLWGLASVAVFVYALRVFYRDVLSPRLPREMEAGFLLLTLGGALRGIWSLQSNAVLMACILLASAAIIRGRWWKSAWLLALPIYIKVWPALVAGIFAMQWPRKLLVRGVVCCAALAVVPFATKPPAVVVDYYQDWIQCLQTRQATAERFTGYRDAWTIWEQFDSTVDPRGYFLLQAAGGLLLLAYCGWLRLSKRNFERSPQTLVVHALAAWSVWQLLLGPGSERLTFVIIAPLAAWSVVTSYVERRGFALAVVAFLTMFVLGAGGVERKLLPWIAWAPAFQPIGVVLFGVWLGRHSLCRARTESAVSGQQPPPLKQQTHVQPRNALADYSGDLEAARLSSS